MNLETLEEYNSREKTCKNCGASFYKNWTKYTLSEFCSESCSRQFSSKTNREITNRKISSSLKKKNLNPSAHYSKILKERYYSNPKLCVICGKIIEYERKKNKTCSRDCHYKCANLTKQKNGVVFIENGQGRGKTGYYKDFFCNSTYELVYYIFMTEHGHCVERNTKSYNYEFDGKKRKYTPDFRVDDKLVEIKGYYTKQVQAKIDSVTDEELLVLYYGDLEYMMVYVDEKYGTKHNTKSNNYFTLYDNHKHEYKYEYTCDVCGKKYQTNYYKGNRFKNKVCSRECQNKCNKINMRNVIVPDGFVEIPDLEGYFINKEKKVWSSWFGGKYIKLYKQKGVYEYYCIKNKWYNSNELYKITIKSEKE